MLNRERVPAYLAFATVCLCWGTNFLAIRVAIETLPTLLLTGLRFAIAGGLLAAVCLLTKQSLPRKKSEWRRHAVIGTMMIGVGSLGVVWAEHYITSGWTALLLSTGPFWMVLTESLRGNHRQVTPFKLAGIVIGFAGVVLLVAPKFGGQAFDPMFFAGVAVLQFACIAWSIGSVWSKYGAFEAPPFVASAIQMLAGGVTLCLIGLLAGEASHFSFTTRTFAAFAFLTVFGSLGAYSAYVYSLSKLSTITVSLYDYVVPAIAVVLGWLVLSEPVGWRTWLSLALITSGVAFDKILSRWFSRGASLIVRPVQEEP
ncbi:MAG TPA: EamA family transporter [Blastocatellia bacterium]|nr:EamA family transporter [Blastocatellia bacterium]